MADKRLTGERFCIRTVPMAAFVLRDDYDFRCSLDSGMIPSAQDLLIGTRSCLLNCLLEQFFWWVFWKK